MKSLIVFALVGVLLSGVMCDWDDYHGCSSDQQCDFDECCMAGYCRDKGDDIGDRCGGQYACSTCDKGLTCVTGANGVGICQRGTGTYRSRY